MTSDSTRCKNIDPLLYFYLIEKSIRYLCFIWILHYNCDIGCLIYCHFGSYHNRLPLKFVNSGSRSWPFDAPLHEFHRKEIHVNPFTNACHDKSICEQRKHMPRETTRKAIFVLPSCVYFSPRYSRPKGAKFSKSMCGSLSLAVDGTRSTL